MSFDWSEYLRLAREITDSVSDKWDREAALRCAISRAYYAAFCAARNHLEREGQRLSRSGLDHRDVPRRLRERSDAASKQIASHLERLRIDRNRADYHDTLVGFGGTLDNLAAAADEALRVAEEVISVLPTLNP